MLDMGAGDLVVLLAGPPAGRWGAIVGAVLVTAIFAELFVRKLISRRLAGAATIVSGALVATFVGHRLFPAIMVSSPDSTTFSIVGAIASAAYWLMLQIAMSKSSRLDPIGHLRAGGMLVVTGIAVGAMTGMLSGTVYGLLYSMMLGLFVSGLLSLPYFLAASWEIYQTNTRTSRKQGDTAAGSSQR